MPRAATCLPLLCFALACSSTAGPSSSHAFSFSLFIPGQTVTATGDSTYWEIILPQNQFSAFLSSADSVGATPPPINFFLIQPSPFLQNGTLPPGSYSLNPNDPQPVFFSVSYPNSSGPAYVAAADSGTLTILSGVSHPILQGQVTAWVHQTQPSIGAPYRVTGQFHIKPKA